MKKIVGFFLGVIILVLLILMGLGIKVLFFPVHNVSKSIEMAYDVTDKTLDADKAIAEYEWFKRQAQSMKALEKKENRAIEELDSFLQLMEGNSRKDWDRDDKKEYDRLNSNKIAVQNMLDDALAEYNARSEMVNRAIFKDTIYGWFLWNKW